MCVVSVFNLTSFLLFQFYTGVVWLYKIEEYLLGFFTFKRTNEREYASCRYYERQRRLQPQRVTFLCLDRIYDLQLVSNKYRTLYTTSFDCFDWLPTTTYCDEFCRFIRLSSTRTVWLHNSCADEWWRIGVWKCVPGLFLEMNLFLSVGTPRRCRRILLVTRRVGQNRHRANNRNNEVSGD